MIRVSVEVGVGDTGFQVTAQAESIEQAVRITRDLYSGREVRVLFPIEPESFFVVEEMSMQRVLEYVLPGVEAG